MSIDISGISGPFALAESVWDTKFLGNEVWQWLALAGVLLGGMILGKIAAVLIARQADRLEVREGFVLTGKFMRCIERPMVLVLLSLAMYSAATFMNFEYSGRALDGVAVMAEDVQDDDVAGRRLVHLPPDRDCRVSAPSLDGQDPFAT